MCVLTAIGICSTIGGAHQSRRIHVSPVQVLVFKFAIVNARRARTVAVGDISALNHERFDNAVERRLGERHALVLASA